MPLLLPALLFSIHAYYLTLRSYLHQEGHRSPSLLQSTFSLSYSTSAFLSLSPYDTTNSWIWISSTLAHCNKWHPSNSPINVSFHAAFMYFYVSRSYLPKNSAVDPAFSHLTYEYFLIYSHISAVLSFRYPVCNYVRGFLARWFSTFNFSKRIPFVTS